MHARGRSGAQAQNQKRPCASCNATVLRDGELSQHLTADFAVTILMRDPRDSMAQTLLSSQHQQKGEVIMAKRLGLLLMLGDVRNSAVRLFSAHSGRRRSGSWCRCSAPPRSEA